MPYSVEDVVSSRHDEAELRRMVTEILEETDRLRKELKERESAPAPLFQIDTDPADDDDEEGEQEDADTQKVSNGHSEGSGAGNAILFSHSRLEALNASNATADGGAEAKKEDDEGAARAVSASCFNCLGDHMIADCPKPRNPRAIAANRREFQKNQGLSATARYHVDEGQKFGHVRPGSTPSRKLRDALGLRDGQLPPYVYRLRELGYPPGWLREAQILHSGLSLYLGEGEVLAQDADDEDGEIADKEEKVQYDVERIVEWPGFNAPPPDGARDETHVYRCPRFSSEHSKSAMVAKLSTKAQKGYVRGEMQNTARARKRRSSGRDGGGPAPKRNCGGQEEDDAVSSTPTFGSTGSGSVRSTDDGTPIVEMYSPYRSLPSQSAWAKDTTDHILFENLPDSTGKWSEMREVIKRGRMLRQTSSTAVEDADAAPGEEDEKV